jgi:hypothetical protein
MVWFYVTLALVTGSGVFFVARLLRNHTGKRLIDAWVCLATSACFFVVWALEDEHRLFTLIAGLIMLLIGVVALIGATVKRST